MLSDTTFLLFTVGCEAVELSHRHVLGPIAVYARPRTDDICLDTRELEPPWSILRSRCALSPNRVVDVFSEIITVVAYNLDFDSYLMFKTHASVVHEFPGGRTQVEWTLRREPTDPEVVRRCLNFVIDTAIRLEALA
jgi:hypothetical protein